ncbi:hypothetical protein [Chitinophaga qingshengii]|uniref:DUF4394 domain-containing protein n=1 Tax=Chitinophaga qingshengii TaxID=1569794 RepID=A0ABR7TXY5_9BACT|nr:hypothetical protein [Chitinophaga qingshengii]MBC9934331.1 hypothetical protein [Chitinophaga qingshengii]
MKKLILGTVILTAMLTACSKKDKNNNDDNVPQPEKPVVVSDDTLAVFKDLEFDVTGSSQTLGIAFSSKDGKLYSRSNLPKDGQNIDVIFAGVDPGQLFFSSPTATASNGLTFDNARITEVMNTPSAAVYDPAKFDTLSHKSALKDLPVKEDNSFFTTTYKGVVLFKNAAGKVGVIKVTSIDAQRLKATIKVQP